ncbi:MAG: hypothetical protein IRY95_03120 [Clostridia bacterium]|nr:hypothetical protein [Clostridia bacterium]
MPVALIDLNGTVHVLWSTQQAEPPAWRLLHLRCHARCHPLSRPQPPTVLDAGAEALPNPPAAVLDACGLLHVVYRRRVDGRLTWVCQSFPPDHLDRCGPVTIGSADGSNAPPLVATAGRFVLVAWTATGDTGTDVLLARRRRDSLPGAGSVWPRHPWEVPERLLRLPASARLVALTAAGDDAEAEVTLVWQAGHRVGALLSRDGGVTWRTADGPFGAAGGPAADKPSAAAARDVPAGGTGESPLSTVERLRRSLRQALHENLALRRQLAESRDTGTEGTAGGPSPSTRNGLRRVTPHGPTA